MSGQWLPDTRATAIRRIERLEALVELVASEPEISRELVFAIKTELHKLKALTVDAVIPAQHPPDSEHGTVRR